MLEVLQIRQSLRRKAMTRRCSGRFSTSSYSKRLEKYKKITLPIFKKHPPSICHPWCSEVFGRPQKQGIAIIELPSYERGSPLRVRVGDTPLLSGSRGLKVSRVTFNSYGNGEIRAATRAPWKVNSYDFASLLKSGPPSPRSI